MRTPRWLCALCLLTACASGPHAEPRAPESMGSEPALRPPAPPTIPPPAPPSGPLTDASHPVRVEVVHQQQRGGEGDAAVALLPPVASAVLIAEGDGKVRVLEGHSGALRWRSSVAGEAPQVARCHERIAVVGDGVVQVAEWVTERHGRVIDRGRFQLAASGLRGFYGNCAMLALDGRAGSVVVLDTVVGSVGKTVRHVSSPPLYSRVSRYGWLLAARDGGVVLTNLRSGESFPRPLALRGQWGELTQAHVVGADHIIAEHCDEAQRCRITLLDFKGAERAGVTVDGRGSRWGAGVPSLLEVARDGRHALWWREGLAPQLIELESGRRGQLPTQEPAGPHAVAFSHEHPDRFVVADSQHITVLKISR
jgi:hypothetical protein